MSQDRTNQQQLLPTFSPSEADMVQMALDRPLERKIEQSINLLKCWEEDAVRRDPDNGYQVGFSGGKDSCVIKQLCIDADVKFKATYNNTTIDPPPLLAFIKKHHADVEWNTQPDKGHLILKRMVEKMSVPTRLGKWCCSEYKDCCSKSDTIGVVGVRAAESTRRAKLWKEMTVHNKTGRIIIAPICYWADEDVWEYIRSRNLPYCEMYDQGWDRLGCVGCPINPSQQQKEFDAFPKYEAMWREGMRRCWEKGQTVMKPNGEKYAVAKFTSPEALYDWWITGEKEQPEGNCVFEEMMEGVQ